MKEKKSFNSPLGKMLVVTYFLIFNISKFLNFHIAFYGYMFKICIAQTVLKKKKRRLFYAYILH